MRHNRRIMICSAIGLYANGQILTHASTSVGHWVGTVGIVCAAVGLLLACGSAVLLKGRQLGIW